MKNCFTVSRLAKSVVRVRNVRVAVIWSLASLCVANQASAGPISDFQAPKITQLTISSTSIDASTGSVTENVSARITDDLSGLSYAGAYYTAYIGGTSRTFYTYFGDYNRVGGTAQDGIYHTTLTIPQYAAQGTYDLYAYAYDNAGNNKSWSPGELGYLGDITSLQITSPGDLLAPTIAQLSIGSTNINASTGSVTEHVTAHITDGLSGLSYAGAYYTAYVDGTSRTFYMYFGDYNRVSGTAQDGIYDTTLTIPQYAAQGSYDLYAYAYDNAGNNKSWSPGELGYLGGVTSLQITSPGDLVAPKIAQLLIGSTSIDSSNGSVTEHVSAHITDDLSGLSYAGAYYTAYVDGTSRTFYMYFGDYNRISGTAQDGVYDATLTIPQYAAQGTYDLYAYAYDNAGNNKSWSTGELGYLGNVTSLTIGSSTVPEPTSIALVLIGLAGFTTTRRRISK